jgi:hypothetical protein
MEEEMGPFSFPRRLAPARAVEDLS